MNSFLLLWLPLSIIVIICSVFMWVMAVSTGFGKRKYDEEKMMDEDLQTDYSRLVQVYEFLSRFPLTSKSTNQLHDIMSGLSIYNDLEQRVETARIAGMSYLLCIAVLAIVFTVSNSNLIFSTAAFVLVISFRRDFVNKRLRKKRLGFWQDLLITITSMQQEYQRSKSLSASFSMCQAEASSRFLLSNIEAILKSEDPDGALTYFCANNPFHICIRLAYLCYNTHRYSAVYVEREGADSFVTGLDTLLFDLQTEIDLATTEKKKFYTVEKLPLVGLVLSFAGPWFMQKYFTGLRYYYNDGFGFLSGIIALTVVVGAYIIATRLNDKDRSQEDVTAFEINYFHSDDNRARWNDRIGGRMFRFERLIEKSLSYLTPEMLMLRKVVYSLSLFLLTIILCISYVLIEKKSLETNYKTLPESAMEMLETNYEDYNFVVKKAYSDKDIKTEEDMYVYLNSQGWNLSDTELRLMAAQTASNKAKINTLGFTPIHLFLAFIVMLIGFNIPEIMLERRAKMVQIEAKSEVLLLQAVVIQLMYTPLKLKDYLIFFSSISRLYASTHLYCYVRQFNFPEDIKKAAYTMFDAQYYLLMEQLYTLHSSMKAPQIFRETASARRYLAQKYLIMREEALAVNYSWMSALLKAALLVPVVLQIVLPLASFVSEALQQYSSMMPQ